MAQPCIANFVCNGRHDELPLPSESVDLICCFDVVEHIPDFGAIAEEWRRVLRPEGKVWVWWSPWRGPYGHHLESLIPLPWIHLIVPERTIFGTCAELYDDPKYVPRKWDVDPDARQKKPNKWRHTRSFYPFLNRLTRRGLERAVCRAGLRIRRREVHGFGGSRARRMTRGLLPIPFLGECVTSFFIYELVRTA
jgi:SAM-dependent methyltransferase